MSNDLLLISRTGSVITFTLNRPQSRNALNAALLAALFAALDEAEADDSVRAIVLTGAGGVFCAGGDLAAMHGEQATSLAGHEARQRYADLYRRFSRLTKPTLAAVNGHAIGGGLGIVCACDLALAVDSAKFGTPDPALGLFPAMLTALLLRSAAKKPVMEMMLLGERSSAARAAEIGLINRAVPGAEFKPAVRDWAQRLAQLAPRAVRLGREAVRVQETMTLDDALSYLNAIFSLNLATDEAQAGIRRFLDREAG